MQFAFNWLVVGILIIEHHYDMAYHIEVNVLILVHQCGCSVQVMIIWGYVLPKSALIG